MCSNAAYIATQCLSNEAYALGADTCCMELKFYTLFCSLYLTDESTVAVVDRPSAEAVNGMSSNCSHPAYFVPSPTPSPSPSPDPCPAALLAAMACGATAVQSYSSITDCCNDFSTMLSQCSWASLDALLSGFASRVYNSYKPPGEANAYAYGMAGVLRMINFCVRTYGACFAMVVVVVA